MKLTYAACGSLYTEPQDTKSPYGGGRQLFLSDYTKQHAPSPLRAGRCYFIRSITGGAVCGFKERASESVLGLWVCIKMCVYLYEFMCIFVPVHAV